MSNRRVQLLSTKFERKAVMVWMMQRVEESGSECRIVARAVEQFPGIFRQTNPHMNYEKPGSGGEPGMMLRPETIFSFFSFFLPFSF